MVILLDIAGEYGKFVLGKTLFTCHSEDYWIDAYRGLQGRMLAARTDGSSLIASCLQPLGGNDDTA